MKIPIKRLYRFILLSIAVALIIATLFILNDTYAKYLSKAKALGQMSIAKWNIKVNDIDIRSNTDISQTIQSVLPGNEYIRANILAPTATGYFDLSLNFIDVDVAFSYEINIKSHENNIVKDLIVTGYSLDNNEEVLPVTNNVIKETIPLDSSIKQRAVRVYFKWNDDESAIMNNMEDTNTTLDENSKALLDVNLHFSQVTSE